MNWFDVDKKGLAKLIEKRGKAFALYELVQNCFDTNATRCDVRVTPLAGKPYATVEVEDNDPEGFKTLAHAFTLFAESEKKGDPEKRGRFNLNLGEKLVLALCDEAEIQSTTGSVCFDKDGRHVLRKRMRAEGSKFIGTMRMTRDEYEDVYAAMKLLLPPPGCATWFNGERLCNDFFEKKFETTLPTEVADDEGYLRRTERKTLVTLHKPAEGEPARLYEMGIPVVELTGGERLHVNVHQKVPLNADRDNVTPAYLQTLRVAVANALKDELTKDDADKVWLAAATEDERIEPGVVETMLDKRFGKKRAVFDPNDLEANKQLMNEGYTVIAGGSLSRGQWQNVKGASLAAPSGKIRPTGVQHGDGEPERRINPTEYTRDQGAFAFFTERLGGELLGFEPGVKLVNEPTRMPHVAWWGNRIITVNIGRLGKRWLLGFADGGPGAEHLELLIHEFAHDKVSDHLTREFADEVGRLAINLALKIHVNPSFLRQDGPMLTGVVAR